MKKVKFILPFLALAMFSCSDYLDINTSPNDPNAALVTPNLSLAGAETNTYRPIARNGNILGNLFMNNWGYNVNAFAVTNPEEFSLTLNNNSYSAIWDGLYTSTANLTNIINYDSAEYDNHKAIAKILKSYYFQYLVDLYGDIPYFGIHQGSANLSPAYDDDQAVYRDLVTQIDQAIAMIDNPVAGTKAVGGEDVIMGGDMNRWKKFGNTLKLRILLRQSMMTDAETTTYLAAQFATLQSADFIASDVTINPGYSNASDDQQNPFYNMMYELNEETEKDIFRQYRASKYFGDELNTNPPDPRRSRIFQVTGGNVVGVLQGDTAQAGGGTAPLSISGLGPGVVVSSSQNGYIMTLAEGKLLQCEAVHRGFLPGGAAVAQQLFDEAIAASFAQLGAGDPSTYIASVNNVVGKGYGAGGSTPTDQLRAIMYQKNIALTGTNSLETFIEYTRTGFIDEIPLATGATQANKPRRLLYPNSEIVGNTANVPSQQATDIFTNGSFWWMP